MKKLLWIFIGMFFFLIGCQEDELTEFTQNRYIKFRFYNNLGADYYKSEYSFAYEAEEVKEKKLTFPVEFKGYSLDEDLSFKVEIDTGTTLSKDSYVLPEAQVFRKGVGSVDSLKVTILRTEELQEGNKLLRLKLVSNEYFQTYMADSSFIEINVNDVLSRPEWWDSSVENAYLGKYSKAKHEEFVKCTGVEDFGELDPSAKRHYALQFKRYLEENPQWDEENNEQMQVTILG